MTTSITCSVCSKTYKTKQGYDRHIEFKRCKVKDCSVECSYCNKIFSNKYNKRVHEIKCLQSYNNIKIKALEEELKIMRTTNPTQIVNNNTTNNNNGTINNIIINSFGSEDTSYITNKQIIKALKMCKEFPLEMIKITHFNKDKPENHNFE